MEHTYKKILSLMSLLLPLAGFGQVFTVDIVGQYDPSWGTNLWDLNATATISFGIKENSTEMDGFITVDLVNEGKTTSQIVEFYMLRPFCDMGDGFGGFVPEETNKSIPETWMMDNSIPNSPGVTAYDDFTTDPSDYFGMHSTLSSDPLYYPPTAETQDSGTFVFYFSDLKDMEYSAFCAPDWYNNSTNPLVMIQWQGVGGADENDVSIGIGGGPNFNPAVPEPREVALLAMLGLGGLLWTRNRFGKK